MIAPVVRSMRPRQWTKNLLVVAAPLAAGRLFDSPVWWQTLVAFVAFCLVSGAVYLVNDSLDVESDRVHPRKQHRPIAAGELSIRTALVAATVATVVALAGGTAVRWQLGLLLLGYLALQVAYSIWLKHEPVLDLAVVAVGFLLRAVAGGLAAGLFLSNSFLMVAGFGSLFMVAGKRYSELHTLGSEAGTRRSLIRYTDTYLRFVWSIAATSTALAYCLWAFEQPPETLPWQSFSIVPFVLGLLRYAVDIDAGHAAEPEDIVLGDRGLQAIGAVWFVLVCLGVLGV
ncbi:decaprenyl-phosphate phosphoribosyltransferase [Nocardioides cynanchi]|uniref:decaprenyl-phosphate phosphoribosyltransferase n=1 Tax=Nocardioides cynanchi TaxID=2558918 RepID=UPI001EE327EC|nr:decaprenyl-phosphate phosphoribosyltransferase [Nocardioides cynanchi]